MATDFPIWNKVKVGNLGNVKTAYGYLLATGIQTGGLADKILKLATFEGIEITLDLVKVSVKDLRLRTGATTAKIYATAQSLGLSLCPAEVAVQLLLQYPNLPPRGECLMVAMEPIVVSGGGKHMFFLDHYAHGRRIRTYRGRPDPWWEVTDRWVFVRA